MIDTDEFLEHYGKKGMHWGVRKGKGTPKKTSSDHKKIAEIRKKRPPQLTNKQLKAANERINLEMNFNRLNPTKVKRGQATVKGLLGTATAAVTIYNLANSAAGKAAISAGKKAIKK